jgi:hypothetical protein
MSRGKRPQNCGPKRMAKPRIQRRLELVRMLIPKGVRSISNRHAVSIRNAESSGAARGCAGLSAMLETSSPASRRIVRDAKIAQLEVRKRGNAMFDFLAIRDRARGDIAGVKYDSDSGIWRLEMRIANARSPARVDGARLASGVKTPESARLPARLKSCPDEKALKWPRNGQKCKSVAIIARRRGLFSVS